ncbi:MAG: 4Fe-4S dicluster domain-containing protein [Thermoanaerobaculia bacterium]
MSNEHPDGPELLEAEPRGSQEPEFPGGQRLWQWLGESEGETRRDFLKAMGFSLAAASAAGCRIPERRALPLAAQPEGFLAGAENWYATTCGGCSTGCGLTVKVRDGRPIKIEGNPDSLLSRGGTCAAGQATVLSLYDDERFAGPLLAGKAAAWTEVDAAVAAGFEAASKAGKKLVWLGRERPGPAGERLLRDWQSRFPGAEHRVYEPLSASAARTANEQSFGLARIPRPRFDRCRLVVGLEADFLGTGLSPVEHARAYAERRRPELGAGRLRHLQVESAFSLTGASADRRWPVHPSELGLTALALLAGVSRLAGVALTLPGEIAAEVQRFAPVAEELWARRGAALVLCGDTDPDLHRVVNRLNSLLGGLGATLDFDRPSYQSEGDDRAFASLVAEMERGEVGALLLEGVNPAYDSPLGERFVAALERVPLTVSFADRPDETTEKVQVVAPDTHFLESWGDHEPVGGCYQLSQPMLEPLFAARHAGESLLAWSGRPTRWYDYLRETWKEQIFPRQSRFPGFDEFWDHALEQGGLELPPLAGEGATLADRLSPAELEASVAGLLARGRAGAAARSQGRLELRLVESIALGDGRLANNPWLQELPDPTTKITWANALAISPFLAAREGLEDGEVVRLTGPTVATPLEVPVVAVPGLAASTVTLAVGYGRRRAGKAGTGVGVNAFPLAPLEDGLVRTSLAGVALEKTGRREVLARTQQHFSAEGRPIAREIGLAELEAAPEGEAEEAPESLWPEHEKPEHFWAMTIDLGSCTGCSACVVACMAENNVPVVGPDEVRRGREMHWLRVDRYYQGDADAPEVMHQPMMCQHCDHAPCETVCPVLATVHSSDGLNQQVYNRCIGTRYCANNCPYKVRRFNWFRYADNDRFDYHQNSPLGRMVLNPDVVVRSRGVMEKCSLCIQRIQAGKLEAKRRGRPLADGAISTACQQACPSQAIHFGDLRDDQSTVAAKQKDRRFYRVLADLGTRPGVGYLARVRVTE